MIEAFYAVSDRVEAAATREQTLKGISQDFAPDLSLKDMEKIVEQTRFYKTADAGMTLFEGAKLKSTMKMVNDFCISQQIIEKPTTVKYVSDGGAGDGARLTFDSSYMKRVKSGS